MPLLPYGICVIGLLSVYTLGQTLQQLKPNKEEILQLFGDVRIRTITMGLLVIPVLIAIGLAGAIAFVLKGDVSLRAAHATLVLGLWMVLTLSFLALVMITRLNKRPSLATLVAPVLAVPLTAYLTPLDRFGDVFGATSMILPLMVGVIMIIADYFYVWQVKKELL